MWPHLWPQLCPHCFAKHLFDPLFTPPQHHLFTCRFRVVLWSFRGCLTAVLMLSSHTRIMRPHTRATRLCTQYIYGVVTLQPTGVYNVFCAPLSWLFCRLVDGGLSYGYMRGFGHSIGVLIPFVYSVLPPLRAACRLLLLWLFSSVESGLFGGVWTGLCGVYGRGYRCPLAVVSCGCLGVSVRCFHCVRFRAFGAGVSWGLWGVSESKWKRGLKPPLWN